MLLTPLVVSGSLFFPYITGKNFFFRIIVELTFGAWLGLVALNRAYAPKRGLLLLAVLLFFAAQVLATLFGVNPYHSFWSNFERMEGLITYIHVFMLFLVASSVLTKESEWRRLFLFSVGVMALISIYGLLEKTGVVNPGGSVAGSAGAARIFSTLGNPIYLAAYLLIHFFILLYLYLRTSDIWLRVGYVILFLFGFYIFISTGTRGAILGLAAGVGVMLLILLFASQSRQVRLSALGLLGIAMLGVFGLYSSRDSHFVASRPLLIRLADFDLTSSTIQSRVTVWKMAWEGFKERPIFGWGPENFIIPYAKYYIPDFYGNEPWFDRTHNMFLEWLVDTGIVGFALYLGVFGAAALTLWRLKQRNIFSAFDAAIFAGVFVAYMVQNFFVFDNVTTYMLIALLLAYLHRMDLASHFLPVSAPTQNNRYISSQNDTIIAALFPALALVAMFIINLGPIRSASGIIYMLSAAAAGDGVGPVVSRADKVFSIRTFGLSEAHERLTDLCLQVGASPPKNMSEAEFSLLIGKCIEGMEKEVANHPQFAKNFITLAKLYELRFAYLRSTEDRDKAISMFEKARELAPNYPHIYIGLAETYLAAGDGSRAVESTDSILQRMKKPNTFFYTALTVSTLTGDFDTGIRQIREFLVQSKDPQYPTHTLERVLMHDIIRRSLVAKNAEGRKRFLLEIQKGFLEGERNDTILLMALAETEHQLGNNEAAKSYALEALQSGPEYKDQINTFLTGLEKTK